MSAPAGAACPVLVVVTHLLGVGHLTRAAAIARGLAAAGHPVTLVSGGRPAPLVDVAGLDFVQLPPVHCRSGDFSNLLTTGDRPLDEATREARIAALLAAYHRSRPSVVVTETYPFGRRQLAAEFGALLAAVDEDPTRPALLASVRDILNPPSRPAKGEEANRVFGRHYDGALVHGEAGIAPLAISWPVTPAIEKRLHYTGYVGEASDRAAPLPGEGSGEVLVSGGNSAASLPLYQAALGAARLDRSGRPWRILVGRGVEARDFEALATMADADAVVERVRPDFRDLLARAAVSVSQAGYNTVVDLALAGTPAVLVPYEEGSEAEQALRAEQFGRRGIAVTLRERDLSPARLLAAVAEAAMRGRTSEPALAPNGIAGSVAAIRAAEAWAREERAAWGRLDAGLDALAAAGRHIDLWWRDDDAERPTPALDRLLDLAARHGVPLSLAVSPDLATEELAERLRGEASVTVLVHGIAHRNNAPEGRKKQELGFRPLPELAEDLRRALPRLADLFGARMRPVLVPPWNRIDPDLVPRLSALGFAGLSTFGARGAPVRDGLAIANTHVDPIDWRGGVKAPAASVDELAARLGSAEPVGLLTHHLVHDEWTWRFLETLLARVAGHPAVRFASAASLFDAPSSDSNAANPT